MIFPPIASYLSLVDNLFTVSSLCFNLWLALYVYHTMGAYWASSLKYYYIVGKQSNVD